MYSVSVNSAGNWATDSWAKERCDFFNENPSVQIIIGSVQIRAVDTLRELTGPPWLAGAAVILEWISSTSRDRPGGKQRGARDTSAWELEEIWRRYSAMSKAPPLHLLVSETAVHSVIADVDATVV